MGLSTALRLGFTGHRDKEVDYQKLIIVAELFPNSVWTHGGAIGFDEQVDKVARFYKKDKNGQLVVLKPLYHLYHHNIAPKERNKDIVDTSDIIFSFYDGRAKGGTYHCIQYAQFKEKPVINLLTLEQRIWLIEEEFNQYLKEKYNG